MSKKRKSTYSKRKVQAIHYSHTWPYVTKFANMEAKPILYEIKNRKTNDPIRKSLINYLVVRSVSTFEYYFINMAQQLGDNASQADLEKLLRDIIPSRPKGEQLASSFNYANLSQVNSVFSTLQNISFLDEVKKDSEVHYRDYYYEFAHIPYASPLHKNWQNFLQIFDLRDDIVHHNKNAKLGYKEIRNLVESVIDFIVSSSVIL